MTSETVSQTSMLLAWHRPITAYGADTRQRLAAATAGYPTLGPLRGPPIGMFFPGYGIMPSWMYNRALL